METSPETAPFFVLAARAERRFGAGASFFAFFPDLKIGFCAISALFYWGRVAGRGEAGARKNALPYLRPSARRGIHCF